MKGENELKGKNCLLYFNLDFLSKKWMILVLFEFYSNPKEKVRYSQILKKLPGITSRVLSRRLDELVKNSIIVKKINKKQQPNISEYQLTRPGEKLIPIIESLRDWGNKYYKCNYKSSCKRCIFR